MNTLPSFLLAFAIVAAGLAFPQDAIIPEDDAILVEGPPVEEALVEYTNEDRSHSQPCWKIYTGSSQGLSDCCDSRDPNGSNCLPSKGVWNGQLFPPNGANPGRSCEPANVINWKGWSPYVMNGDMNYCANAPYNYGRRRRTKSPTKHPTRHPTPPPTKPIAWGGCHTIKNSPDCCASDDGRNAFYLQPCRPGQWPSGNLCEPSGYTESVGNFGWKDCGWTGWVPPTPTPTKSPTVKRYMSGCMSIKSAEECCKYADGLTWYSHLNKKYADKGLNVEGDPCLPGQWNSGFVCEPKSWVDTQENSWNHRSCSWTGWTPPSKAPTSQPTFPQCDLHDADFLMANKQNYLKYIGSDSEMMKCKAEIDITLPFVTDIDTVMDTIGKNKDAVTKMDDVLEKLDKITSKVYPLVNSIPKVGQVSKMVEKIQSIVTTVVGILKNIVSGAEHVHSKVTSPAKTILSVAKDGINTIESKVTTYFQGMTTAYNCKNQRCTVKDELNKASRMGKTLFEDYQLENVFQQCEDKLSAVNGAPKDLWDKVMSLFNLILPGLNIISGFIDTIMGYVDKLASDAIGLMNAAKCCLPDQMQDGAHLLVQLFNLLMCPLHGVEISLMKKVKEVLSEKMLELVELLVPDIKFDFSFDTPTVGALVPGICGADQVGLDYSFKLSLDLKGDMMSSFQQAMNSQSAVSSGTDIANIGALIAEECTEAFNKFTAPPPPTCDCALMDTLSDMAGGVVKLSEDGLNAAKSAGAAMGNAAEDFNSYAGDHLGETWNSVKDVDYGNAASAVSGAISGAASSIFGGEE